MARPREFDVDQAIDRAMHRFWRDGYVGTSMRDLVAATGVRAGSLHAAFGGKAGIFAAAFARYGEHFLACIPTGMAGLAGIDEYSERLAALVAKDAEHRGCLIVNTAVERESHEPATLATVAAHFGVMEAFFLARTQEAIEAGELPPSTDATARARLHLSAAIGLLVISRVPMAEPAPDHQAGSSSTAREASPIAVGR